MTATRRYICNDISLDIQTLFGTISQQPTANSQQPIFNLVIYTFLVRAVLEFEVFSHFIL